MELFLGWIIVSFVVGFIGSGRTIGFWGAFFASLLLSPLIGLVIVMFSKSKEDEEYRERFMEVQQNQHEVLKKMSETDHAKSVSVADELEKLKRLRESSLITEEEFQKLKQKVINS